MQPVIHPFFHQASFTLSYVVYCEDTKHCAIIDPALDLNLHCGTLDYEFANSIIRFIKSKNLFLEWILETHAHADHITAANYIQQKLGGKKAISKAITKVQTTFKKIFNWDTQFNPDGSQFDLLLEDNMSLPLGNLQIECLATPGHTPDGMSYKIADNVFVGDTLFMPDSGSARCDFPGGDAQVLYQSIQRIYRLEGHTNLYMCHDYQPNSREVEFVTTVAAQKQHNIQINASIEQHEYVAVRNNRDSHLKHTRMLYPALQFNILAGQAPAQESNKRRYIKIPLTI